MAEFLDEKRKEIDARLKELKPLVVEYQRLEAAATALAGIGSPAAPAAPPRRGTLHPAATTKRRQQSATTTSGRGRPKGSGKRATQALALVTAKMGIKQNYLYRVLPGLAEEGKVVKDGRGWHPKAAA